MEIKPIKTKADYEAALKDIESALFAVKFYPVAVDEKSKKEAVARLETLYTKGNDTVRQLLLYNRAGAHDRAGALAGSTTSRTGRHFSQGPIPSRLTNRYPDQSPLSAPRSSRATSCRATTTVRFAIVPKRSRYCSSGSAAAPRPCADSSMSISR